MEVRVSETKLSTSLLTSALGGDVQSTRAMIAALMPVIHARVGRALLRRCARFERDRKDDLVQDVFVELLRDGSRALRAWDPARGLSLANWVGLIADQRVAAALRGFRRRLDSAALPLDDAPEGSARSADDPEATVLARDQIERHLGLIRAELSPLGLELFEALIVDEEPIASVCARTGMSASAVQAWSSRLRRRLAALVAGAGDDEKRARCQPRGASRISLHRRRGDARGEPERRGSIDEAHDRHARSPSRQRPSRAEPPRPALDPSGRSPGRAAHSNDTDEGTTTMKKFSFFALAGAVFSIAPVADAAIQNHHGVICRAREPEHAGRVRYPGVGVEALQAVDVSCPLITTGKSINYVEVNVRSTSLPKTLCSVSAVDWDGESLSSINFFIEEGEKWNSVTIPESMKRNFGSYHVSCSLPKNQVLTSINVSTP
ncbi:sigma-70 family RNA polymerase sigma factor [Sorangium sp. So ce136]|uniref:RNA polymerase sigma factor n=1 Tax=Sorangium sp. So ce136 TaxID=3133284 RepID=UPI003F0787C4